MISLFGTSTSLQLLLKHNILKFVRTVADGFKIVVGHDKTYKNKLKILNYKIKLLK